MTKPKPTKKPAKKPRKPPPPPPVLCQAFGVNRVLGSLHGEIVRFNIVVDEDGVFELDGYTTVIGDVVADGPHWFPADLAGMVLQEIRDEYEGTWQTLLTVTKYPG